MKNIFPKLDDKKTLIASILFSVLCLVGGVIYLLGQWEYYESGQGILLSVYSIACFALFFALRFNKITQIISAILLLSLILYYANQKFEWRKTYIQNALHGNPFVLDPYIDEYPTMEENAFSWIMGKPKWVSFATECVEPALKGNMVEKECRGTATIEDTYNINPSQLVNNHFAVMKKTAIKIENGDLKNKRQYQACLNNKTCAIIPLLPADVDPEKIDPQSNEHLGTRKMFWSLVNDRQISPEICEYMELCRALRDLGVMPIKKP